MRNAMLSALRRHIAGMFVLTLCFLHSVSLSCSLPFFFGLARSTAGRRAGKGRWLTLTVEHCLRMCVLDKQVEGQRWRWGVFGAGDGECFP